ncbi:MAG: hypothetical protein M3Z41_02365 [Candidatus Eremiobacteraeota bacterium]|nr:hypothetical protein [Candidatus Eremiobacteraeota bacterium]
MTVGPRALALVYQGGGFENGVVTSSGIMYVTQVFTVPQGTMRQFYRLSTLLDGKLTPVQLPPPSKNLTAFPGYLYLGFDDRSQGNSVLVDASDYDGHAFVLSLNGQQSSIVPGLQRGNEFSNDALADGSRCSHTEPSALAPAVLWAVDRFGRKTVVLTRAALSRATRGVLDTTYQTSIDLTCGNFQGQNFVTVSSVNTGVVLKLQPGGAVPFTRGFFQISGYKHALISDPGSDNNPGRVLELISR